MIGIPGSNVETGARTVAVMCAATDPIPRALRLQQTGDVEAAIRIYQGILKTQPKHPDALHFLGLAERQLGRVHRAIALLEQSLAARPDHAIVHSNLGVSHLAVAHHDEAIHHLERAVALKPDFARAHSNLVFAHQYRAGVTLVELDRVHRQWYQQHGESLTTKSARLGGAAFDRYARRGAATSRPSDEDAAPIRLGFVSPDLWTHPVGIFLVQLLERLDRTRFHATCYATRFRDDDVHSRIRAATDVFVDARRMQDDALDARIRSDAIDVLFDLAGHTQSNRLALFSRRPAPIQASWMGYVGTTGLDTMNAVFADKWQLPEHAADHMTESIIRLDGDYICFDPPSDAPDVGALPAIANGHVTFGSFNNPSKLTDDVIALWSRVLHAVNDSKLFLKYKGFGDRDLARELQRRFGTHEIDASRIILKDKTPRRDHLDQLNHVDIALDTFPYCGGLTTCEAIWMGVPTVTLPGETFASRHSLTHLSNAGLARFVANDADEYVSIASSWAGRKDELAALRSGMRDAAAASPMCDGDAFTRAAEAAILQLVEQHRP